MKVSSRIFGIFIGVGVIFFLSGLVSTSSPNEAASIQKGFGCGVIDGDGFGVFTPDGRISVVTSSGNTTLICKAKGVANSTGKAVRFEGFACGTALGLTFDSQNIVSASGNVTLRCRINHD